MSIWEILMIGVGLSMDAVAVSISNGLACPRMTRREKLSMPIAFGLFQGLMPLLGFFAGSLFADVISRYAGIVTLVILGFIGGKMVWDAFFEKEEGARCATLTMKMLLVQAIATSIDAFAVGVSFCASGANIFMAAPIIAATTFVCSLLALVVGKRFGALFGSKAQVVGGLILIAIGVKAMF